MNDVFAPLELGFSMAVTDASGATTATLVASRSQVVIHNDGASTAYVNWGQGATEATSTASNGGWKVSCPANSVQTFTKGANTLITAICAAGQTTTLRVMQGTGE